MVNSLLFCHNYKSQLNHINLFSWNILYGFCMITVISCFLIEYSTATYYILWLCLVIRNYNMKNALALKTNQYTLLIKESWYNSVFFKPAHDKYGSSSFCISSGLLVATRKMILKVLLRIYLLMTSKWFCVSSVPSIISFEHKSRFYNT